MDWSKGKLKVERSLTCPFGMTAGWWSDRPFEKIEYFRLLGFGLQFFYRAHKDFQSTSTISFQCGFDGSLQFQAAGRKLKHQHHCDGDKIFIQILPTYETEFLQCFTGIDASINFRILLQSD